MSVFFLSSEGEDAWNPSSDVAEVFLAQADTVARLLKIESGLGPIRGDEVIIDGSRFAAFGAAFARRMLQSADDSAMHKLLGGCFAIILGLHAVLEMPLPSGEQRFDGYASEGQRLVWRPK